MYEHRSKDDHPHHLDGSRSRPRTGHEAREDVIVHNDDELLTIPSAARRAGVSRAAILSWIRNGFLDARTSSNGWVVRAGDIEAAHRDADDARAGRKQDINDRLNHQGQAADSERVVDGSSMIVSRINYQGTPNGPVGDSLFSTLAEFVRDQSDIVQEQAETIGWLQAELRRAREQLRYQDQESIRATTNRSDDEVKREPKSDSATENYPGYSDEIERFADAFAKDPESEHERERAHWYHIIAEDPFSDEASRARMMIEETERKIVGLWDEHEERRIRHAARPERSDRDFSRLNRIFLPWKRRET